MKFFLAAFGQDPARLDQAVEELGRDWRGGLLGQPDFRSPDLPLTETNYYEKEMGPGLVKRYLSWPTPLPPDLLPELKLAALALEETLAAPGGARTVNLDPGYVFAGGLVLSTGKFSGHRLYLGQGVWGELTLHYHRGAFEALPWSYRDYQKPEVVALLGRMRADHLEKTAKK
jgi:hypothetical protein